MPEEEIKHAINQAAGNNKIEGHNVSDEEKNIILRIYQKYQGNYGDKAIDSLLFGIAQEVKDREGKEKHVQFKK